MGAYIVKCNEIVGDDNGEIVEIRCTADLETRNGMPVDGRKVMGTIHWVSAEHAIDADLYLYETICSPSRTLMTYRRARDYLDYLNPDSLKKPTGCKLEPSWLMPRKASASSLSAWLLLQGPRERPIQPALLPSRTALPKR